MKVLVLLAAAAGLAGADDGALERAALQQTEVPATTRASACPPEMTAVDQFCIDKWEASVVDKNTGQDASPYFVLDARKGFPGARWQEARWKAKPHAKYPLPPLPPAHASDAFEPKAVSRPGVYPQGFSTRPTAELACKNAGKRLCTRAEWYKACAGSSAPAGKFPVTFPYGPKYAAGTCNFNVSGGHPLLILGRSSSELDDPRLMLAEKSGKRLLARTGDYSGCVSPCGVYDMVGNQDEIVADRNGQNMTFVGSFYSRDQSRGGPQGCASAIIGHVATYFDYSLGFRCCADRSR